MPTVTLNKDIFERLVGKKLSFEQLKDRISMLGTDLEKIEGNEIHVEIFPNRPDMLSEQGFARAFSSFIGVNTGLRKYNIQASQYKVLIDASVQQVRPYTACAVVKNVELDEERIREIIQIQEKLHGTYGRNRKKCAIGVYPLEKITFPITYKADLPEKIVFQPLDGEKKMTGKEILTSHKTGKEFAHLLQSYEKYPFFIDAQKEILSMPPIINSENVGRVTAQTKDLFIECSGFDFPTLSTCLNIIVTALADMGGNIYAVELSYGKETKKTPDLTPSSMRLDHKYVNKMLGLMLSEKEIASLLQKMGFGYEQGIVLIPAYRADILHQTDLVEDIAIAYGYEHFPEEIPKVATIGQEAPLEIFSRKIREILVGFTLLEVQNYHLLMRECLVDKMNKNEEPVSLKNSVGDHDHLRNSLLPSLLKTVSENQHNEYPQNIFELGRIFHKNVKMETGIEEKEHLGIILCHEKTDFTEIRQILDGFMRSLGLICSVKESSDSSFLAGRVGKIIVESKEIGVIGEIHPQILEKWGITMPVVGMEVDVDKLMN